MAYVKNNWVDREGTTRYFETIDDDGALILTPDYTKVTEMGTPVNADNMNHIEEGIAAGSFTKYDSMTTYAKDDLVTAIIDNGLKAFRSLADNNNGNALTDTEKWAEVEFGGGGTSLPLGAPVIMDRVLSYEESKGYALQGTYVYKEAIAGSRYGYPDFYNKCVEEKEAGTVTETTLGDNIITLYVNSNGHRFYDIADKAAIDSWYDTYGIADFYGVDTENERIFLPRNKYFMQLTDDTSKVNEMVEAGLPNITGNVSSSLWNSYSVSGVFEDTSYNKLATFVGASSGATAYPSAIDFKASNSNSIYGNSETVQPPSSLKLLYYVVGNTTATEALTNVTDITTSENDTLPWGYNFYSGEFLEPALGYVASIGQWLNASDWSMFWGKAEAKLGQNFAGGKIVNHTDDYTDYDLVLNQDEMTFRLPLLNGDESIVDYDNYTVLPLTTATPMTYTVETNGAIAVDFTGYNNDASLKSYLKINGIVMFNGSNNNATNYMNTKTGQYLVSKGDVVEYLANYANTASNYSEESIKFIPIKGNGSLYFKLSNAVQNQELLDVAKVTEVFSQLTDVGAVVIDVYKNNESGYILWSNGYCEQWGRCASGTAGAVTINLLLPMKDTSYRASVNAVDAYSSSTGLYALTAYDRTTTTFTYYRTTVFRTEWTVRGYIA